MDRLCDVTVTWEEHEDKPFAHVAYYDDWGGPDAELGASGRAYACRRETADKLWSSANLTGSWATIESIAVDFRKRQNG